MTHPVFEVRNLSHNNHEAYIKNISLKINQNEIHSLVMKDSTEQNLFIEALQNINYSEGEILFEGQALTSDITTDSLTNEFSIEILNKNPLTFENMTIAENVNLMYLPKYKFLPILNWKKIHNTSVDIFNKMNLNYNPKEKLHFLSEEDRRFVYMARVLLQAPTLIVMHEPTENFSPKNAAKMYNIIKQFKEDNGCVLFITKHWEEALKVGDQISIINRSNKISTMTAEEAKEDPQLFLTKIEGYNFRENENYHNHNDNFLNTVFKAAEFLTSEYELKDVLLLLAKEVCKFMHADGCSIKLLDEETWSSIDDFEYKNKDNINVQLTKDMIIKIAKSNDIFYINQRDKEFNFLFEKNDKVKTFICVPVLIRSQVTGLISIYYEDFYVYSKEESQYLSALAKHAAIAIEDTRLMGRSTLLNESHHRIKNNLQSIVSLITLQKNVYKKDKNKSIDELLDNVISRIKSIATVHNILSKDPTGRSIINLKNIIDSIIGIADTNPSIEVSLNIEDIFIPYNKATSIALIINELVINCHKHAFKDRKEGFIQIAASKFEDHVLINVYDNGVGMPDNFDLDNTESLGLNIMKGIVQNDFKGSMEIESEVEEGTHFIIKIPSKHLFESNS
ncbi:GAF domain-containing protein [Pontibacillus yanchengensis]|uniref:histidine kinase n=1 Tax=Pontibacillus yanchengensis TaxID=462910 RepID=A0A6I5A647_9BACI|nr:histidine kinase dimerization/phosphoacceptor domain -containing protein [Pontibacillus yanchengensis]MYL35840.1 GAF domain-containing protein [Pontibacillus yanchengensis]